MLKIFRYIFAGYIVVVICLFLYSYTQVDLNLTLSRSSVWQTIQKSFQYIGWFERPLSTAIYAVIFLLFTIYYILFLWAVKKNLLAEKQFWLLVVVSSVILLFSYNAFSYDLFNYMFDARIFTFHHENPYNHKALDYLSDPWINFMRWTHRYYPYGPVWLGLTIPLSFIGLQFFLPTLFLFKALMAGSFLASTFLIGKIIEKISSSKSKALLGMAFFAFNPLVIFESLVSAHHDIVMMAFSLLGLYFLLDKKYLWAFLFLFLSIGIKFSTAFLLPVFVLVMFLQVKKKKINWGHISIFVIILMVVAVIFASIRTELQPWYVIWILPFVPLLIENGWVMISFNAFTVLLLFYYVPFLYTGNWNPPIPAIKFWITVGSATFSLLFVFIYFIRNKFSLLHKRKNPR